MTRVPSRNTKNCKARLAEPNVRNHDTTRCHLIGHVLIFPAMQEVKECVIMCIGKLLAALGDRLTRQIDECLPLLLERLRNEITRLAAVKVHLHAPVTSMKYPGT